LGEESASGWLRNASGISTKQIPRAMKPPFGMTNVGGTGFSANSFAHRSPWDLELDIQGHTQFTVIASLYPAGYNPR
jgi:hypothetical protein